MRVPGLEWIDRLKGVAMLWVVLNHVVEQLAGGNFAADATGSWPPLHDRILQWQTPVAGFGQFSLPLTGLRDTGWLADQAVSIFIILSGFGLALGQIAAHAKPKLDVPQFLRRRLRRIYPYWWGAHILFLPTGIFLASGLSTSDWQFYASFIGLRCIPGVFAYFASSWWYVGVIIELYVAFPVLWWILRARGPWTLLAATWGLGFLALAFGHAYFHGDLVEMWQRGIFAVTRFPEFGFGMALALWWTRDPGRATALLRKPSLRLGAAVAYVAGFACSFTLPGMIVAPTILGIGAIVLLYPLVAWRATGRGPLEFIGRHSFTLYLTHQYIIQVVVRRDLPPLGIVFSIALALLATVVATFVLERGTADVEALWQRLTGRHGPAYAAFAFGSVVLCSASFPVALELLLRASSVPSQARWNEVSALERDDAFGWRYQPSSMLAVHGRSDYHITSNADGFPGPDRSARMNVPLRVFVLGDAISSVAAGDATAWPQLLERDLAALHRSAEVANSAVDGYGPNQEASVASFYAPRYRPDVVLVQVYPDDVRNVLASTTTLLKQIGLGRNAPSDERSILELERLRAIVSLSVVAPLHALLVRASPGNGYSLGNFIFLERGHDDWDNEGVARSAERYREIARAASAVGAQTILVFLPAPAQVCGPATLAYYPPHVALGDRSFYDVDLPDRRARSIAAASHMKLWDLSADLRAKFACAYIRDDPYLRPEAEHEIAALLALRLVAVGAESGLNRTSVPADR